MNPNLRDSSVVVEYGQTSEYGLSAPPRDVGAGNGPVPISVPLNGLAASTTYHYMVVASNGDGTSTSGDGTFTTPPVPLPAPVSNASTSIVFARTSGSVLTLMLACKHGSPGDRCAGPIALSSHVTTRGASVIAVTASASRHQLPPPKVTKVETVASGSYTFATGRTRIVKIPLNSTGQSLLAQFYKLSSTLALGGTTPLNDIVNFHYRVISAGFSFTWSFTPGFTVARQLAISSIPAAGQVEVLCHGRGCPFAKRTFSPRNRRVSLTAALKNKRLRPGTTMELEITALNHVGKVAIFTIRSGAQPSLKESCLPVPPARCGARDARACGLVAVSVCAARARRSAAQRPNCDTRQVSCD